MKGKRFEKNWEQAETTRNVHVDENVAILTVIFE